MRRRTLDVVFSAGGMGVAAILLVLGLVLSANASFARDYVADQLGEQQITFKPAEALTEDEAASACLVEYAGQPLTTGKQAECYANDFIGLHLKDTADGMTYAQLGTPERETRMQLEEARAAGSEEVPEIEQQLADISAARDTVFKGETLRGLLLTTYGFSIFGEKAAQAGWALFGIAALLAALSVAGFVHAFVTPRSERVRIPDSFIASVPEHRHEPEPVKAARPKAKARSQG